MVFRPLSILVGMAALAVASPLRAYHCPFCAGVAQPLSQEMSSADIVGFATIVKGSVTDADAVFKFVTVLKGDKLLPVGSEMKVPYFGSAKPGQNFLLLAMDPPDLLWSFPRPVSKPGMEYLTKIVQLPKDPMERLRFFMSYLEHSDRMLAGDAYDEFAPAPYEDIVSLKDEMDREKLLGWIKDTDLSADRRRLYFVMLGICGKKSDAKLLEAMMRSDDPVQRAGLDSMIACHITLLGEKSLDLIDELFIKDKQRAYGDTYAALQAIRFHGTEGTAVSRDRLLVSLRLILDRTEYADLPIPDLARWEDWTQVDRLAQLFREADTDTSWVRVPIFNYLRACPLPKAKALLNELKELDPAAYKRSTSYYPVQRSGASLEKSASASVGVIAANSLPANVAGTQEVIQFSNPQRGWVSDAAVVRLGSNSSGLALGRGTLNANAADLDQQIAGVAGLAAGGMHSTPISSVGTIPNRFFLISVVGTAVASLWIAMWLLLSGAGNPAALALLKDRV